MANAYWKNQVVRLSCTFAVGGAATDPTTVTLIVKDPSGTSDTYTYALSQVTKSGTGAYYKDVTLDEAGPWHYHWYGTGACGAADQDTMICNNLI